MRIVAVILSLALLALAAAVVAQAATRSVSWKVGTNRTVSIHRGDTVKWVWADGKRHNVSGPGLSTTIKRGRGKSVSRRFGRRGTFRYICVVHPSTMKTTVKVG